MEKRLLVVEVDRKQVWFNTGSRVVKLNTLRLLPSIIDNDERDIMTLLKSLTTFSTGGPPGVLITEYITSTDFRQCSEEFKRAKEEKIKSLFKR